jgi:acetolactate synthase-1/2/3 large subunit
MSKKMVTGGEVIAKILGAYGVTDAFGVISIHNIPILDAFKSLGNIRFISARGEAGATNMADGYARVKDNLGVVVTSTGPGAGNAGGAMTEAVAASTPLLHFTGQIDSKDVDCGRGMNHETHGQLDMLRAISKAAFRVRNAQSLPAVLTQAIEIALTAPRGPVSIEIPIDIQTSLMPMPEYLPVLKRSRQPADVTGVEALAQAAIKAKRPMLWLGDGARGSTEQIRRLMRAGFGVVTSIHGRAIISEDDPMSMGTLNNLDPSQEFFDTCDLMIVVGSRLRGNETRLNKMRLPRPLMQIDIDVSAWSRNYDMDLFVRGDSKDVLTLLADCVEGHRTLDAGFAADLLKAKKAAHEVMQNSMGPYAELAAILRAEMPADAVFVRDVTISANTWAHRLFPLPEEAGTIHALGGGIGQGLQHAIGAKVAAGDRKVYALVGDGGLSLNVGELTTAVQEKIDLTIILMNDGGYGVIRNILDANFGGRQMYSDVLAPDWQEYSSLLGIHSWRVRKASDFKEALQEANKTSGVNLIEVDMNAIGPFGVPFAGPRFK